MGKSFVSEGGGGAQSATPTEGGPMNQAGSE